MLREYGQLLDIRLDGYKQIMDADTKLPDLIIVYIFGLLKILSGIRHYLSSGLSTLSQQA